MTIISEETIKDQLAEVFSGFHGGKDEIIPILQAVQERLGYLPRQAMQEIARFLRLQEPVVYGVSTFYAQFRLTPSARQVVRVCRGTACHVRGGARILREVERQLGIKPGEATPDMEYALETVACFGSCALGPVVVLDKDVRGRMTIAKVKNMVQRG